MIEMIVTCILVNSFLELVNGRGDLKSLQKDSLLSLNPDIFGPSHKTGEVSLGLDVASNSEVAGVLLKERAGSLAAGGLGLSG